MASFGHGGNAKVISRENELQYEKIIDFSANINPLGAPTSVKKAIIDGLDEIEKYPDITYFELKNSIGEYENIDKDNIILGNGAAEVLFNIIKGINPRKSLILAPTFSEYEEAVRAVNGNIIYYELEEENNFYIQENILEYIDEKIDLMFICNPNNPTGIITSKDLMERILIQAQKNNVILLIDESFLDFMEEDSSMISYINKYENLVIIKSLTKFFALPGIRIGYAICNSLLKEKVERVSPAWNINILAEIATKVAVKDNNYIMESIKFMKNEKKYLFNELSQIKELKVFKPSVNFILLKNLRDMDLKNELLKNNILIRSCHNYKGLNNNFYRVAVRTHAENVMLIQGLKNIFEAYVNKE